MMQRGWDSARAIFERLPADTPRGTALRGDHGRELHFTGKRRPWVLRFHSVDPDGDVRYWPQRADEAPQEPPRAATFSIRTTAPPRAINHARFSATHRVVNDRWVPAGVHVEQEGARKGKAFIRGKWRQPGTSASGHHTDYPAELLPAGSKRSTPCAPPENVSAGAKKKPRAQLPEDPGVEHAAAPHEPEDPVICNGDEVAWLLEHDALTHADEDEVSRFLTDVFAEWPRTIIHS